MKTFSFVTIATAIAFLIVLGTSLFVGCEPRWVERQVPTTDTERALVAQMEMRILENVPGTLSGNDQDWDDVVKEAHLTAEKTICKITYWEYSGGFTGRWKYADQPKQ